MLNEGYSSSEIKMGEMEVIEPSKKESIGNSRVLCISIIFLVILVGACLIVWFVSTDRAKKLAEVEFQKWKQEQSATTSPTSSFSSLSPTSLLSTTSQPICTDQWCKVRLPDSIIPYHYNLKIEAYPPSLGYQGVQVAFLNITQPTDVVLFHIKLIEVINVSINEVGSTKPFIIMKHFAFPQNEYYVVQFESKIPAGNYQLEIHFKSNISDSLTGFYKSFHDREKNDSSVLFTTKFQPTDARKAFPCLDEPNLKATFNIEIIHPQNYHARSNMPGYSVHLANNKTSTKFNQTVRMSTYLVCFVVSQFEMKYSGIAGKDKTFEIAIWSRPELVNSTEYAFNISVNTMNFLEEFLNVRYPMPKLDMFGIPDYASGATEHWGIITYREARLLYTPGVSSVGNMKSTAGIIGHECAHLWFGNLVTCAWWNDLWIQEGLASYLEYYTLNSSHPEWNVFDEFLTSDWLTGITLDALASSHPISQNVDHPSQIKEIFDSITYNKGSSLFHMLDFYLDSNHNLFRAGLEKYLTKYQYQGATTNDLWVEFTQVAGWNVTEMMDTWTQQMGFPVITIKKTSDTFLIEQSHFLVDPTAAVTTKSKFNYEWIVPFTYATSDSLSTPKKILISKKSDAIVSSASWIIGNFEHRGFYRVNYDSSGWDSIIDQLLKDFKVFSVTDRAGIIDDAFNLARSGRLGYSTVFRLLSFIDKDDNARVWEMVLNNLKYLGKVLSSTTVYSHYRAFVAKKIKPMVSKKFNTYVSAACEAGETETIQKVKAIFDNWMKNDTIIPADIRSAVLKYGVENGGDAEWDFVFKNYINPSDPSDKSRFQTALAASQKPWLLKKWLDYSIDGKTVRTQDTVYVISNVASNPVGKYVAWTFAEANWNKIISIAKENNFHVNQFITGLTALMSTEYELQKVKELWAAHANEQDGVNARQQSLEKINSDVYWLKTNYDEVSKWFHSNAMI